MDFTIVLLRFQPASPIAAWGIVTKVKVSDKVGENLALIVTALTDMLRRGSTDALEVPANIER
jgi:hypothetical protein